MLRSLFRMWHSALVVVAATTFLPATLKAQELLDRVVARVGADAITQMDLKAALGFGIVNSGSAADEERVGLTQLIERQLELAEVPRAQPEPDDAAVNAEVTRMKQHAGANANDLMTSTGVDDERLRDLAHDSLRIQTYLENRFPYSPVSDVEAEQYFRAHPEAFPLTSFEQAAPEARAAAAAERRRTRITQWLAGLMRNRVEVTFPTPP
jgi:hypothetical protein